MREVYGWSIEAVDGAIGHVADVYFDDHRWTVRHLVVVSGHRPLGRKVVISPSWVRGVDVVGRRLRTGLTRRQVALGPDIDVARPVSRQHELELSHYYGFPSYAVTVGASVALTAPVLAGAARTGSDPHLRSARAITGYYVHALDADVGHADDLLVDSASWAVRHLLVSVGWSWWPVRKVLVPVGWIARVSWGAGALDVSLPAETIRLAPEYDRASGLSPEQETRLTRYYGPAPFPASASGRVPGLEGSGALPHRGDAGRSGPRPARSSASAPRGTPISGGESL